MRPAGWSVAVLIGAGPWTSASAQDLPEARAFVTGLYQAYNGDGPDDLGRQAASVFAPPLLRLIRRDAARTPAGELGAIDGDPICDCQDFAGPHNLTVAVTGGATGQARAIARFQFGAEWRTVKLDLVVVPGHWRVGDVHTAATPSLTALLQHSPARQRK
jgi:hypothetical protein